MVSLSGKVILEVYQVTYRGEKIKMRWLIKIIPSINNKNKDYSEKKH